MVVVYGDNNNAYFSCSSPCRHESHDSSLIGKGECWCNPSDLAQLLLGKDFVIAITSLKYDVWIVAHMKALAFMLTS